MLVRLSVSNLAVVEQAEIEFGAGLTVITGETGAGKSVLLGALALVLGGRAEASVVRDGAKEAVVEAVFGDHVVRRTVTHDGRSRAWLDDESVSISELREFGLAQVDIHGPTANQRLLEESFQRAAVDSFGGLNAEGAKGKVGSDYAKAWSAYSTMRGELNALETAEGASDEMLELLRFQVGELQEAKLSDEDDTLAERHAAAAHAEEVVSRANAITELFGGDRGVVEMMCSAQPLFRAVARHLPAAEEWAKESDEITIRLQELSRTVADAASKTDLGEEDLEALDERMTVVNRLKRKYRVESAKGLLGLLNEKRERLSALENRDERMAALRKKLAVAEGEVRAAGRQLTKAREQAARKMGAAVTKELNDLGFLQAKFHVDLRATEPRQDGCDEVVFMFEPNPGEPARALATIASSGEVARVMLALKVVLAGGARADAESALTLVFDEIDANIGGEIGRVVGEKMRAVSKTHQVIAITHLPQSAVYGARHFVVSKTTSAGRTRTTIAAVEGEERVSEIARMLGGEKLTSVVRKHAEELLKLSR